MEKHSAGYSVSRDKKRKAVISFLVCVAVMISATLIKFGAIKHIKNEHTVLTYISVGVAIFCVCATQLVYMFSSRTRLVERPKTFAAVYAAITLAFVGCLYLELINVFVMPVALAAFLIAPLSKRRDALMGNLLCNILLCFVLVTQTVLAGTHKTFDILTMFAMGVFSGSIAAYWVATDTKRLHFLLKGLAIAVLSAGLSVLLYFAFGETARQGVPFWKASAYLAASVVGQVVLALILQPIFEAIFNLITDSRLVELTDHNSPLIHRLLMEAPGTFNHCLAVANFAEMCATAIGENPYLARAAAYYHDVGKLMNPQYFKENQAGYNPHDELLPEVSAEIIRSHTTEGLRLCEEHRIPHEISDVTVQHHGTLPIYVFYSKAKQLTDGEVDLAEYSYHGVTPRTKIAAIIMLCDTGEAAIRAMTDPDGEKVDKLLRKLIADRIAAGQFDQCDISLRDLDVIRNTIIDAYGGQFHKRLEYPDGGVRK